MSADTGQDGDRFGVYGFRLTGLEPDANRQMVPAPDHWPSLSVTMGSGGGHQRGSVVNDDTAHLELIDGVEAHLVRFPAQVTFTAPEPLTTQALLHPFLSGAASIHCHWRGLESLHGGAFVNRGKAWGLLADREGGKSTLLAHLAAEGLPILTDDLIGVDGQMAFAGPRSVDLRDEPAPHLGSAEYLGTVGARLRWRITLGSVPAEIPVGGWFFLAWSNDLAIVPLTGVDRLRGLGANRSLRLVPRDPLHIVRLAALPGWRVERPRGFEHLRKTTQRVLEVIEAH